MTVVARRSRLAAAWAARRGGADVVVEDVDGRCYMTPLWWWLDAPSLALADDVAAARERLPLRLFYGGTEVLTHDTLDTLLETAGTARPALREQFLGSDTGKAAGLAAATLVNNAIQLIFTVIVTRVLGKSDYGALAALISAFLILMVGGQALQAAAAREVARRNLGDAAALRATLDGWMRTLAAVTLLSAAVGFALRDPLAALVGVDEHPWGAAALLPTGGLWMLLSLQRGVLQGLHAFRPVAFSLLAEASSRLGLGVVLAVAAGVTGAYLATPLCFLLTSIWLTVLIDRRLGGPATRAPRPTLRALIGDGWVPIVGLALVAVLQNVDVIIGRHQLGDDPAGSYAVAAVAAKAVVWVAIGVGLQLLPQATARAVAGEEPRPVLLRALAVMAAIAAPALLIFAAVPGTVLRLAFGPDTVDGADALTLLGPAMTMLAVTYLSVQYLFALGHVHFLWALGLVAAAEVAVLLAGSFSLTGFAATVLCVQAVAAATMLALALRARPA
ncbi:MAG TPA: oligosaccharide flippase family protein [Solirubrobacteraceae bacterium]